MQSRKDAIPRKVAGAVQMGCAGLKIGPVKRFLTTQGARFLHEDDLTVTGISLKREQAYSAIKAPR